MYVLFVVFFFIDPRCGNHTRACVQGVELGSCDMLSLLHCQNFLSMEFDIGKHLIWIIDINVLSKRYYQNIHCAAMCLFVTGLRLIIFQIIWSTCSFFKIYILIVPIACIIVIIIENIYLLCNTQLYYPLSGKS